VKFADHGNRRVVFIVRDPRSLELLIAQYRLCLVLSEGIDDIWRDANRSWISYHPLRDSEVAVLLPLAQLEATTPLISSPVISDPLALAAWQQRCRFVNRTVTHRLGELRVVSLTWNVGSLAPQSDMAPFFASLILTRVGEPDVAFVCLQRVGSRVPEWTAFLTSILERDTWRFAKSGSVNHVLGAIAVRGHAIVVTDMSTSKVGRGVVFQADVVPEGRIAFVGCHLSSAERRQANRQKEIRNLIEMAGDVTYVVFAGDANFRCTVPFADAI
jgi:hypothetical protein